MVAVVDAPDLKHGSGNRLLVLLVQLLDGQIGELLVFGRHCDSSAAIDNSLIHMGADGARQLCEGCRCRNLDECIHAFRHIGDRDLAGGIGGFRTNQLAILEDVEYRTGKRPVGIILLDQLNFDFCIVFKHERYIRSPIPVKFLTDLAGVLAERVSIRRRYLRCNIAADRHGGPGHVAQGTTCSSRVGAGEVIIDACDFDDCACKTSAGIVRIDFPDIARCRDNGRIGKGDCDSVAAAIRQDNILRTGIIDLIAFRRFGFRDCVSSGIQRRDCTAAISAGRHISGKRAVGGFHMELSASKALGGIRGINFLDDNGVLLMRHAEFANHDALNGIGRMCGGTRAREGVLIHRAIAPYALIPKIQDILCTVSEGGSVIKLIDIVIVRALQRIPNVHQLFSTSHCGIAQRTCLVPPHNCLHPGIHVPGILWAPDVIHAECVGLVCEGAGGVCVVIGHHRFDSRVGDGLRVPPGLTDQRCAHATAFHAAEADGCLSAYTIVHLMQCASAKAGGLIGNATHAEPFQLDGVRAGCKCSRRDESKQTNQRQQHCCHSGFE